MTDPAADNLALLDVETGRLLASCARLVDPGRPSLCKGWDVAHVLTHVARNADALGNLARWAVDGTERQAYPSDKARDVAIEEGPGAGWRTSSRSGPARAPRCRPTS